MGDPGAARSALPEGVLIKQEVLNAIQDLRRKNPQAVTPAMQGGISDHVWSIEEIVLLLDAGGTTTL